MVFEQAQIVRSLTGRDKGGLFCVMHADGEWLFLADGKRRKAARPKRKKAKHVGCLGTFGHPVLTQVSQGEAVTDRALRRALAAFRAESRRV